MMKLLLGGSPCTHWSIAQTKNRETEPSGLGWELFLNYKIALEKFKPDYFLYENNKSMSPAIRAQITKELGVEPVLINSALVSAQNRQRLYWVGKRNEDGTYSRVDVEQPEDRGILLRDILESGVVWREKAYTLRATAGTKQGQASLTKHIESGGQFGYQGVAEPVFAGKPLTEREMAYMVREVPVEPVNTTADGKAHTIRASCYKDGIRNMVGNTVDRKTCVAVPVRIGTIESGTQTKHDSKPFRVYSPDAKAVTLQGEAGGYGAKTGLYATPVRVGDMPNTDGVIRGGQAHRIYDADGKGVTLTARPNGGGVDGPLYAIPKSADGKTYPVYEVRDGQITIKGKQYPIKLADGFYIIRKLTVTECKRLQTVPDDYIFPVSDTQAYKMLGNGWTVDVIAHIMSHFEGITAEPLEVLSMYDGMSCGHLALDKLGANVVRYYATEIDKYAIQTTTTNYPDTVQLGDAFQVREDDWNLEDKT